MKKLFLVFLFSYYFTSAQIINFPDINFKNRLLQASTTNSIAQDINTQPIVIDTNGNGEIEVSEALVVVRLGVFSSSISDITGIEYFTNLQYLAINANTISNINILNLVQLKSLRCDTNNLSSLNLTGLTAIEGINIGYNNFSSFNLSNLPNLKNFICPFNSITSLDFSANPMLTQLGCRNNNLTSINIKNGTNHDFSNSNFNDCWKTGNPNLTTICVDQSELASVEGFLAGCGTPQTITVTSDCGLNTAAFVNNSIQLFPNPSQDYLNISGLSSLFSSEKIFATLFSIDGKVLKSFQFSNNDEQEIFLHDVASGIYILKISDGNNEISERFIKN